MKLRRTGTAVCVIAAALLLAPLMPFFVLFLFSFVLMFCGFPIPALLLAILFDSFLVSSGVPFWISLSLYTVFLLPLYLYMRHNVAV